MHSLNIRWYTFRENARRFYWRVVFGLGDVRRFIFTRIIPIAIECDWCKRLMPIEFSKLAAHIRFRGRAHRQITLCDACRNRERFWDSFYDDDDDYDRDEWDDDDDEVSETSFTRYLIIMPDGRLGLSEVQGYKFWGQDWGETSDDQWEDDSFPLLRTKRPFLKALVKALRQKQVAMPTEGKPVDVTWFDEDYYDEEQV